MMATYIKEVVPRYRPVKKGLLKSSGQSSRGIGNPKENPKTMGWESGNQVTTSKRINPDTQTIDKHFSAPTNGLRIRKFL